MAVLNGHRPEGRKEEEEKTRLQRLKHGELNIGDRIQMDSNFPIYNAILFSLIMDLEPLCPKELHAFIT
jgi:hypothetical protein